MGIDGPRMVTALVTKDVMGLGCENCKRDYISEGGSERETR